MKKFTTAFAMLLGLTAFAQTTIYSENFGPGAGSTNPLVTVYTGYQSTSSTYAGTADIRVSTPSDTYTGASGGGLVFLGAITTSSGNPSKEVTISGIDTSNFENITLSFGHHKGVNAASNEMKVEVSENGTSWTPLSYTRPTGAATSVWMQITPTGTIPSTSNLRIRFSNPLDSNVGFRIDDVKLVGTEITMGTASVDKSKAVVYPTLVSEGKFFVGSDKNTDKTVKIYDSSARLVKSVKTNHQVDVNALSKGTYVVTVEENGSTKASKITVK